MVRARLYLQAAAPENSRVVAESTEEDSEGAAMEVEGVTGTEEQLSDASLASPETEVDEEGSEDSDYGEDSEEEVRRTSCIALGPTSYTEMQRYPAEMASWVVDVVLTCLPWSSLSAFAGLLSQWRALSVYTPVRNVVVHWF